MAFRKIHLKSYSMTNGTACSLRLKSKDDQRYVTEKDNEVTCSKCLDYINRLMDAHHQLTNYARRSARQNARSQALGILRDRYRQEYDRLVEKRFQRIYPEHVAQEHRRRGLGNEAGWCAECGSKA